MPRRRPGAVAGRTGVDSAPTAQVAARAHSSARIEQRTTDPRAGVQILLGAPHIPGLRVAYAWLHPHQLVGALLETRPQFGLHLRAVGARPGGPHSYLTVPRLRLNSRARDTEDGSGDRPRRLVAEATASGSLGWAASRAAIGTAIDDHIRAVTTRAFGSRLPAGRNQHRHPSALDPRPRAGRLLRARTGTVCDAGNSRVTKPG